MDYSDLEREFQQFSTEHKENTFNRLSDFFNKVRIDFEKEKNKEYKAQGFSDQQANQKSRQSWVAFLGSALEKVILLSIEDTCTKHNLKIATDKVLKSNSLDQELDLVKRALLVDFGEYSFLPDADLVVYSVQDKNIKIHCILSIKNSFRERYTETPYWKLKLLENKNTENIKVFMITPDNDDEISFVKNDKPRKARIVMEYELDGIYLAKEDFDATSKIRNIKNLENDILQLI